MLCNFIHYLKNWQNLYLVIPSQTALIRTRFVANLTFLHWPSSSPNTKKSHNFQFFKKNLQWWFHVEDLESLSEKWDSIKLWSLNWLWNFTKMKRVFSFLRVFHLSDTLAKHKSAPNRYHVSAIMKLLSGTFLAEKAPAPGSKPIWGSNKCHLLFAFISFYLGDNTISGF